jgi:predicted nucleic acid-binding protein
VIEPLVDSDVIIWALRRRPVVQRFLASLMSATPGQQPRISAVTLFEVLQGRRPGEERRHAQILGGFECLAVTPQVATVAAELARGERSRGRTLNQADAMVAATGLVHDLVLVTYNATHFEGLGIALCPDLPPLDRER